MNIGSQLDGFGCTKEFATFLLRTKNINYEQKTNKQEENKEKITQIMCSKYSPSISRYLLQFRL